MDTAAYTDGVIPPYYDSLVAKLITHGRDRAEAIQRMRRALDMFIVEGIHTSIPLHQKILADADFQAGKFDTNFIKRFMKEAKGAKEDKEAKEFKEIFLSSLACLLFCSTATDSPLTAPSGAGCP